uniref:Uncharacterized protein n=1 Tax=Melanopsichium pennsylvanicum 4 TaxID=1398559 RepID=A0A077R539_9BASI|nr:conserved hypothetical protein [Melanopsichium pennsylvanicum 4]
MKARTPKWAIQHGLVNDRPAKKLLKKREWTGSYKDRLPPNQRMVYDDEGNAHVVEEVEKVGVADRMASWNVHAADGAKEHKIALVEPDRYINEDSSQPKISYANLERSKPSKLGRFKRSSNKVSPLASTAERGWVDFRHRRSSTASTASSSTSGGAVTPEDPITLLRQAPILLATGRNVQRKMRHLGHFGQLDAQSFVPAPPAHN